MEGSESDTTTASEYAKQIQERDDQIRKLKAYAVKLKKEVNDQKQQQLSLQEEKEALFQQTQTLRLEVEELNSKNTILSSKLEEVSVASAATKLLLEQTIGQVDAYKNKFDELTELLNSKDIIIVSQAEQLKNYELARQSNNPPKQLADDGHQSQGPPVVPQDIATSCILNDASVEATCPLGCSDLLTRNGTEHIIDFLCRFVQDHRRNSDQAQPSIFTSTSDRSFDHLSVENILNDIAPCVAVDSDAAVGSSLALRCLLSRLLYNLANSSALSNKLASDTDTVEEDVPKVGPVVESASKSTDEIISQLAHELESSRDELQRLQQNKLEEEQQRVSMKTELHTLRSRVDDLTERELNAAQQVRDSKADVTRLTAQLAECHDKFDSLQRDKQSLKSSFDDISEQCKVYKQQVEFAKTDSAQLHNRFAELEKQNAALSARLSLGDREFQDYEDSIRQLKQQLKAQDDQHKQAEVDLKKAREAADEKAQQEAELRKQMQQQEEKYMKARQVLVKTKKEVAEQQKALTEQQQQLSEQASSLDAAKCELEETKLALAETAGDKLKLETRLQEVLVANRRATSALERTVTTLKTELQLSRQEHDSVKQEFDAYKVRVHSVLRQHNQTEAALPSAQQLLADKQKFEDALRQSEEQLDTLITKLRIVECERDSLRTHLDRSKQTNEQLLGDLDGKDLMWQKKLDQLSESNQKVINKYLATIEQMTADSRSATRNFEDELQCLKMEHRTKLSRLEAQLEALRCQQGRPAAEFDPLSAERESGEGMENPATAARAKSPAALPLSPRDPDNELVSLEQLLERDYPGRSSRQDFSDTASEISLSLKSPKPKTPSAQSSAAHQRRIEHLTELLRESEAQNVHHVEQTRILKEEIRRLERNQQRLNSMSNLEYLKNVVLKFLTMQEGRDKLLPVLTTMLRLNEEEQQKLAAIVDADPSASRGAAAARATWSSYFPRFSGISGN